MKGTHRTWYRSDYRPPPRPARPALPLAAIPLAALAAIPGRNSRAQTRGPWGVGFKGRRRRRKCWRPTSAAYSRRAYSLRHAATPSLASPFNLIPYGSNLPSDGGEPADCDNLGWLDLWGTMLGEDLAAPPRAADEAEPEAAF